MLTTLPPKKPEAKFPKGFVVGAIVSLKMGGVLMCVTELYEGDPLMAYCEWHADGYPQEKSYPIAALRLARRKEYEEVD